MKFLRIIAALLALTGAAHAQSGQIGAGTVWGNPSASKAIAIPSTVSAVFDRAFGSTPGLLFYRGSSAWGALPTVNNGVLVTNGSGAPSLSATLPSGLIIPGYAPLASPAFTGTPTAPTAANGTNTTQLATTAFVQAAGGVTGLTVGATTIGGGASGCLLNDTANVLQCSTALPNGTTATTQAANDNTTKVATDAFVQKAIVTSPARMWPSTGQSTTPTVPWNAVDPFGNAINCAGTNSQCLQEFITATASNGWPAEVHCQGAQFPAATEPIFINSSVGITVPVAQDWDFKADATCNLNVSVTGSTSALTLDSQGASHFIWDGKIVYAVSAPNGNTATNPSCVVYLNPVTNTADGFAAIYAGLIRIKSPVVTSASTSGTICINTSLGSIIEQTLDFTEVNANNLAFKGILILGASSTTGFMQNHVYVNQVHGAVSQGIDEGFSSTNQANYNSNIWVVSNIESFGASSRGIDTWGSYDTWTIGVINNAQGGLTYGVVTESSANNNLFVVGNVSGASSAAKLDAGTGNMWIGQQVGLNCSGTPSASFATQGSIVTHC